MSLASEVELTQIEAAFKTMKGELSLRPIYHQLGHRVEAHVLVAFLAYCQRVTLKNRLQALAPGLTPRAVLETLAPLQMLDVVFPATDGQRLVMPQYTQPTPEQKLFLHQLHLSLPDQPPPRIQVQPEIFVGQTFAMGSLETNTLPRSNRLNCESQARGRDSTIKSARVGRRGSRNYAYESDVNLARFKFRRNSKAW